MSRRTILVEVEDPPSYFRMARTGRVHLVKGATQVTRRDGETHLMVKFWCRNMATDRAGELLTVMPPDAIECAGCERIRPCERGLP